MTRRADVAPGVRETMIPPVVPLTGLCACGVDNGSKRISRKAVLTE